MQGRNQIDLVNMSSIAITIEDKTYKYILSVIDIFSRYLHLHPLESKDSYGISQALVEIYNDHARNTKSFRVTKELSLKAL